MKRIVLCLVMAGPLATLPLTVRGEQQYISDKLVVNVYAEANQESDKLETLESGDAVESIEKVDTFTRIRLADGREGWIKTSYLTAQPTAAVRLKELEKERATGSAAPAVPDPHAAQELKLLKEQNAALQGEVAALKQTPAQPAAPIAAAPEPAGVLQGAEPQTDRPMRTMHYWAIPTLVITAAVLGFLFGYQTIARRIRRKYGSVKIY